MNLNATSLILAVLGTVIPATNAMAQRAPVAVGRSLVTSVGTAKEITLSASDADGDALTYQIVRWPAHGSLTGTPPELIYQPEPAYNGRDSFTFKANDGSADSSPASVRILANDAPAGTVQINADSDNDQVTRRTSVLLTLTVADDGPGRILMCISNSATCKLWMPFAAKKKWRLARGNGVKTVSVWFRDKWRQRSSPVSDTILLDRKAPTGGRVTAAPGDAKLTLNWDGFDDGAGSGIVGYRVVFQKRRRAPLSCAVGTQIPFEGPATTLEHAGLVNGSTYAYRVCAIDAAGNISSGATVTGKPLLIDFDCVECHNGNPAYPLAPNVMKYWDGSWWDTNNGGSNARQQGGHGDPDNKPAVPCLECHDITLPPGTHQDGVYNSIWGDSSGTRNQNTAHLKASFIGGTTPAASVQLTLDAACWSCHDTVGGIVDMRHERDHDPAPGVELFGTHLTRDNGDALPLPNGGSWPGPYPVDQDISTNASGSVYHAPCVSCHDPHGTGTPTTSSLPNNSNYMLRDSYVNPSTLCRVCHT